MKTPLSLLAIFIVCGAFVISGNAQTSASQTIRARIPFTFSMGGKSMPPGLYTISILNPSSDRKVLQIRSENGRVSAITQTLRVKGTLADNAKLVFHRYGDSYFFAQAQLAGESTSLAATKSRAERATERAVQRRASTTEVAAF